MLALPAAAVTSFQPGMMPVGRPATSAPVVEMMARTPLMAGNWKMNTVLSEAVELGKAVADATAKAEDVNVAVCVPFPFLGSVKEALAGSPVGLGAQDCSYESAGAFTGAVSTSMLSSVGCDYIVTGHSERRAVFGDTDEDVNKKTLKVLDEGLKAILCIGELKEERESGETFAVCATQLSKGLAGVSAEQMKDVVIAYEPVWAIGTGLTATPEMAQETHEYIRSWFVENYSKEIADDVIIQYGGSVNAANVDDLMACPDIDGALVGGASLQADGFSRIINFEKKVPVA